MSENCCHTHIRNLKTVLIPSKTSSVPETGKKRERKIGGGGLFQFQTRNKSESLGIREK